MKQRGTKNGGRRRTFLTLAGRNWRKKAVGLGGGWTRWSARARCWPGAPRTGCGVAGAGPSCSVRAPLPLPRGATVVPEGAAVVAPGGATVVPEVVIEAPLEKARRCELRTRRRRRTTCWGSPGWSAGAGVWPSRARTAAGWPGWWRLCWGWMTACFARSWALCEARRISESRPLGDVGELFACRCKKKRVLEIGSVNYVENIT